jgi:hypothetical protein
LHLSKVASGKHDHARVRKVGDQTNPHIGQMATM